MANKTDTAMVRYGIAVVSIAAAIWARMLLDPVLGDHYPFATIFFGILITA
jgi:hypothetical protein